MPKKYILCSLRGVHKGKQLPALTIQIIHKLQQDFPHLPITLCYELDGSVDFATELAAYKQYLAEPRNATDTDPEDYSHIIALYELFQVVAKANIKFISADLPYVSSDAVLVDSSRREEAMVAAIVKTINTKGGIIIDMGGYLHTSRIQDLLYRKYGDSAKDSSMHFFLAYEEETLKYYEQYDPGLLTQKVNPQKYPYSFRATTTIAPIISALEQAIVAVFPAAPCPALLPQLQHTLAYRANYSAAMAPFSPSPF